MSSNARLTIYLNLFNDPSSAEWPDTLKKDLDAIGPNDPNSARKALADLQQLNNGNAVNFAMDWLVVFRSLFDSTDESAPKPRPMSISNPDDRSAAIAARTFWHALVSTPVFAPQSSDGNAPSIDGLWDVIAEYYYDQTPATRESFVNYLEQMGAGSTWTDDQLDDIASIAKGNVVYSDLAWWDVADDAW